MIDPALFAELRDLCLRSFPERLDQRLSQVEPVAADRHSTLAFTLYWREGVQPRVERLLLRHYPDGWTWWASQDEQQAQREWVVMRWLYSCGLPLPRVYALGTRAIDPFLLLECPSGRAVALRSNRTETASYAPDGRTCQGRGAPPSRQHVDALAALLARLHRSTAPESVRRELPRIAVDKELGRIVHIAQECEDPDLMEAVHELIQDQVEEYAPCVLHGDPQFASLKYDARGITAWLNWENSALGDPRWDLACMMNELQGDPTSHLADRFYEVYVERAGLQMQDMVYWQALAATHRWAVQKRAHNGQRTYLGLN